MQLMWRQVGALILVAVCSTTLAADWPQWRGPNRDGVWPELGLPERFPADELKARWRRPIGGGYGGIAVVAGRVYVMDRQKQPRDVERVLCLDSATGNTVWQREYPIAYKKLDYPNGPRTTPTVHEGHVYTYGAVGHLHCLDATTGKVIWSRDVVKDFNGRIPTWGHACSPLVDGPRLVLQAGGEPNACLVALDRATGQEVWRSLPDRPGYSSPVLIDTPGGRQLLYWAAEHVNGLDPATGKVLWQVPHTTNYDVTITDPVYHGGVLLVSDYWEGSKAIRLDERGLTPKVLWEGRRLSQLMCTPLCHAGHVYTLDRHKGLKCIELATGRICWEDAPVTSRGRNPQANLVWAGEPSKGRALIFNDKGELILAKLTPEKYEEIGRVPVLRDQCWSHPGYAEHCIFARNDEEIVCVPLMGK